MYGMVALFAVKYCVFAAAPGEEIDRVLVGCGQRGRAEFYNCSRIDGSQMSRYRPRGLLGFERKNRRFGFS
jgi:hypothetical protein